MTTAAPVATLRELYAIVRLRNTGNELRRDAASAARLANLSCRPSAPSVSRGLAEHTDAPKSSPDNVGGHAGNLMPPLRASSIRRIRSDDFSPSVAVLRSTPPAPY